MLGTPLLFPFFFFNVCECVFMAIHVWKQKERDCISMIKRTVTNDCCLREATSLSWQDIGQAFSLAIRRCFLKRGRRRGWSRATRDGVEPHLVHDINGEFTCCGQRFNGVCVWEREQVCTDASNFNGHMVKPHYHDFLWGVGLQTRVSFIATPTKLQEKASDINSLKVWCAVIGLLCSYCGLAHYYSTTMWTISLHYSS